MPRAPLRSSMPVRLRRTLAATTAVAATSMTPPASGGNPAEPAFFNPAFVQGIDGQPVDLSRFEHGDRIGPGRYRADIYVNQTWIGRDDIVIRANAGDGGSAVVCFSRQQIARIGFDIDALPARDTATALLDTDCIEPAELAPDAHVDFDLSNLRVDASIPQAYLKRTARGYVDPKDWDPGVTAGFVDYNANAFRTRTSGLSQTQYYVGLNPGLNVGDWRLRHSGNFTESTGGGAGGRSRYTAISTYAQRDITGLKSQLTLGQYYTPSDLFDSFPYTGLQLTSDDRMLPDSQRGFAPVIRATALSNARVTVRQGNNVVYETTVAPGPFVIDDLYNTGYAGDLNVSITEANGSVRRFVVPFASVPQLRRPGVSRFSVNAGKYRDNTLDHTPTFVEATYQRGLSNLLTGYAGLVAASHYQSAQAGIALSTSLGAFATDVTFSKATDLPSSAEPGPHATGKSYRLSYSKLVDWTQTNFVVAAYRFSSPGYMSLRDYARTANSTADTVARQRHRFQVNVSQPLGDDWGSLYVSGSAQNYWQSARGSDISYQAGYSNNIKRVNLTLSAGRSLAIGNNAVTQYMLTATVPLGRNPRAPRLNTSVTYSDSGSSYVQTGLSGSAGDASQFSYNVFGSHNDGGGNGSTSGGASAAWQGANAVLSGSVGAGQHYVQANLGLSGSIVGHAGGVNFTSQQGETRALVEAKGATGANLLNSIGAAVGRNGYGIVSGLSPYRRNDVALDPKGTSRDVELQITSQSVAPRYGSVVLLKYPTATGKPLLLHLRGDDGSHLPVGAEVLDEHGSPVAVVGQGSRIFLRAANAQGRLWVRWGDGDDRQCQFDYSVPAAQPDNANAYLRAEAVCAGLASTLPAWPAQTMSTDAPADPSSPESVAAHRSDS